MRCPYCSSEDIQVIITKPDYDKNAVKRRRECNKCKNRFTTYEKIKKDLILVRKNDSSIEKFQEEKLAESIKFACSKRNVKETDIDEILNEILNKIYCYKEQEISSYLICNMVQEELKRLDNIAYIKYILIHKEIRDIDDLQYEIDLIK